MAHSHRPSALHLHCLLVRGAHLDLGQGFKVFKRGGWPWQRTRMSDPARAERLWLALAVDTLWVISSGDALDHDDTRPVIAALSPLQAPPRPRLIRLFRLGHLGLLAAAVTGHPLPLPTCLSPHALPPPFADPTSTPSSSATYP